MTETYPAFAGAGAKLRVFPPGTRTVEVLRLITDNGIVADMVTDYVYLTPHMRGDRIVFAGYHAPSDTWYYTDD